MELMEKEDKDAKEEKSLKYPFSLNNKIPLPKYNSFTSKKHPNTSNNNNDININKELATKINTESSNLEQKILSSIFFKKYKPIKLIGAGTFSVVYEGLNIKDKTKVALKLEEKNSKISLLKSEAFNIFSLQGFGIIKFISFGHSKDFNILVEPLLGETLYSLFLRLKKNFSLKDICLISIQTLERIEYIHSKGYLHGDIKPENFVIGTDQRIIYVIDFGLSKKYRSDRTGNHIQFCVTKKMNGTARYASTNSLRGVEISRRDDLESLAYMILYFIMKKLPWQGVRANTLQNRYKKIYYMKKKLINDEAFISLPNEIQEFYKDIKKLKFEEEPNYTKLKEYFRILLKKNGLKEDNNFSWINKESLKSNSKEVNLKERKSNSQKRLMDKLLRNSNQNIQNDIKEEEKHNNIKIVNSFKYKFPSKKTNSKNIFCNNNEYGYNNSNNKDIKSINEAIDIDVGDFSENEEEKPKNSDIMVEKKLRKYNSDIKRKDLLYKNENKEKNFIVPYNNNSNNHSNNKYEIRNNNIENIQTNYYNNIEIKNFISFNQKPKIENKNENKKNQESINVKVQFNRCNINKNYLINEFKTNKNKNNNIYINNENINNQNIKYDLNNYKINANAKEKEKEIKYRNNNDIKRNKSGEKCSIY